MQKNVSQASSMEAAWSARTLIPDLVSDDDIDFVKFTQAIKVNDSIRGRSYYRIIIYLHIFLLVRTANMRLVEGVT